MTQWINIKGPDNNLIITIIDNKSRKFAVNDGMRIQCVLNSHFALFLFVFNKHV